MLAERAALEAEQLSLEAEKLRVSSDRRNAASTDADSDKAVVPEALPSQAPLTDLGGSPAAPVPFNLSSLIAVEGDIFNESSFVESAPAVTALRQSLERMTEAEHELQLTATQVTSTPLHAAG